jgi:gliding motility-associated-like protein
LSLTASSIAGANYSWSGPNGFSSSLQNPSVSSSTMAASGLYSVTAQVNGCTSPANSTQATVRPLPSTPIVASNGPLCEGSTLSLTASPIAGATYAWGGPNGFVSTSQNPTIANVTSLHTGVYSVNANVNGCTGSSAIIQVIVKLNPLSPASSSNSPVCSGNSISLNASAVAGASYTWTGPNGFTSTQQNPVISNASLNNTGAYNVSVTVNGCTSVIPASTAVTVNQTPNPPSISNNGPLCEGRVLNLSALTIPGATYSWTGPNGFNSTSQNNSVSNITAANNGAYYATVTQNGCTSPAANTSVTIDKPAVANAGSDQFICASNSLVKLSGTIGGGSGSGTWSTNGSGTFSSANTNLNNDYNLTTGDKTSGNLVLTLSSTNNGSCPASSSSIAIKFATPPSAKAGNDQIVCANNANVLLNGQFNNAAGAVWTSSGTGNFSPANTIQNATYIPGPADKTNGIVKLTLTTTGNGPCPAATDEMILTIKTPPVINGGGVKYVIEENSTVLNATVSGTNLNYAWAPGIYLNNDTIANPVCTPRNDILYKVIVKDALGCSSAGDFMVKVLKHPQIPNVFSPNGDGINDRWQIKYLSDYPDCAVDIYDRYGQLIYHSIGYTNAWNGTSKGKQLPIGTYYYIINPKQGLKTLSGFVDIVK